MMPERDPETGLTPEEMQHDTYLLCRLELAETVEDHIALIDAFRNTPPDRAFMMLMAYIQSTKELNKNK